MLWSSGYVERSYMSIPGDSPTRTQPMVSISLTDINEWAFRGFQPPVFELLQLRPLIFCVVQKKAISMMPCLNSWATESMGDNKWCCCFETLSFWLIFALRHASISYFPHWFKTVLPYSKLPNRHGPFMNSYISLICLVVSIKESFLLYQCIHK